VIEAAMVGRGVVGCCVVTWAMNNERDFLCHIYTLT